MLKVIGLMLCLLLSDLLLAEDRFAKVKIERQQVADAVYMLQGFGGNIGVSAGKDGLLIIDDQFEPLAEKIANALSDLSPKPVTYIINTHLHGDHTGSNGWFKDKQGATVFAHHNVRLRMSVKEKPDSSNLPVVTYEDGIKFYFNGERIKVFHLPDGHTDGDSLVLFEKANVLHMGDLFFNGMYPFIDLNSGGSVKGFMANIESVLAMIDTNTRIIPGHGPVASKKDLEIYLQMLRQTSTAVKKAKQEGATLQQVIASGVAKKWQSWDWQFISTEKWLTTLYQGL